MEPPLQLQTHLNRVSRSRFSHRHHCRLTEYDPARRSFAFRNKTARKNGSNARKPIQASHAFERVETENTKEMDTINSSTQLQTLRHADGRRDEEEIPARASITSFATAPSPTVKKQALVLISSFLMIFQTIGINQTYGVFQEFYTSSPGSPLPVEQARNRAAVAFVGTLGAGLTWGGSIFVNPLVSRTKDVRWITGLGSVGMGLGLILAGESKNVSTRFL